MHVWNFLLQLVHFFILRINFAFNFFFHKLCFFHFCLELFDRFVTYRFLFSNLLLIIKVFLFKLWFVFLKYSILPFPHRDFHIFDFSVRLLFKSNFLKIWLWFEKALGRFVVLFLKLNELVLKIFDSWLVSF